MSYFNTSKLFLFPSFDLDEEERGKIDKFLTMLDNSNVSSVISRYIKNNSSRGGRPGYNYYHLFAAIMYGFAFKKYTLRELEEACKYDFRFIYIMEQERPIYTKFCDFINRVIVPNEEEIFSLINKEIAKEVGIVFNLSDAFIDGTKLEANSNKYKFVWKPIKYHKNITIKIENIINKYNLIDEYRHEDLIRSTVVAKAISVFKSFKDYVDENTYKKDMKALIMMLSKVLEYEEKERICGPNRKSYYKTDHDATAMALKTDYYSGLGSNMHAAYNVQNLVIRGFSFAYHVSQSKNDINEFIDINDQFYRLYQCFPLNEAADAGYGSLKNYRYLKEHNIGNYVKHQSWEGNKSGGYPDCYRLLDNDTIRCLNGNIGNEVILENRHPKRACSVFFKVFGCNKCGWMPFCKKYMKKLDDDYKIFEVSKELERYKYESEKNLLSIKGIEIRVNRSIQVEGDFGILKQDYGYNRFRRRGIDNVSTEIMLHTLGLNIAKLFRFYKTGKILEPWVAPKDIEPEKFKEPNQKRLAKKGRKINIEQMSKNNK